MYRARLRVYEKVISDMIKVNPMPGEACRIFMYLLGKVGRYNYIPTPAKIASELDLQRSHVSRAYQTMVDYGYLVRDFKGYRMHPSICYRGIASRDDILKKLIAPLQYVDKGANC